MDRSQKNVTRISGKENLKRAVFEETMDNRFDIACSDVLIQMKNEENKAFLLFQPQKGLFHKMFLIFLKN